MDSGSVQLLDALIASQLEALRSGVPDHQPPRGGRIFPLVARILTAIDDERSQIVVELADSEGAARDALGRKLLRCLQKLDTVHVIIVDYAADAGRQDVPVGVLSLVDALVADLLPIDADPLVHLDSNRMYSTLSLNQIASDLLGDASVRQGPGVVVFNLPALDPANVLYTPILAHEVGHALVANSDLVRDVLTQTDLDALNQLLSGCAAKAQLADATEWKQQLGSWIVELLCDALAVALTGPSFLYASAAFLPAPAPGTAGTHPFPVDRIALTLEQLTGLGWQAHLETRARDLTSWLTSLGGGAASHASPQEEFLRGALPIVAPAISAVARAQVRSPLDSARYAETSAELEDLLERGIPPSALSPIRVRPWEIVLAGWEVALRNGGAPPRSLGAAVADRSFNAFLVKSLELARVTELWEGM